MHEKTILRALSELGREARHFHVLPCEHEGELEFSSFSWDGFDEAPSSDGAFGFTILFCSRTSQVVTSFTQWLGDGCDVTYGTVGVQLAMFPCDDTSSTTCLGNMLSVALLCAAGAAPFDVLFLY